MTASVGSSAHARLAIWQVEDGTPFGRWYPPGHAALPDDEAGAVMYRDASEMLREVGIRSMCTRRAAVLPARSRS